MTNDDSDLGVPATASRGGLPEPEGGAEAERGLGPLIPLCHIYGQYDWHGDAMICGNVAGLTALRDALSAAIDRASGCAGAHVFVTDGEGYEVVAMLATEAQMEETPLPYTADFASGYLTKDGPDFPAWFAQAEVLPNAERVVNYQPLRAALGGASPDADAPRATASEAKREPE